jgi:hypothetical protein
MQIDSDHEPKESKEKKRLLRSKILQQMEFYFSDSNLAKDRFLKNEILNSKDGCNLFFACFLCVYKINLFKLIRI